jgi:NADH dehydrogenase
MKVLVTGGSGVVGRAAVSCLLARGHSVRLFSRHAQADARAWPQGVDPHPGDVGEPGALQGAAEGCQAVLHLAGIVAEEPPERTFQRVNVEGTRQLLAEARRAGVKRFVYVSSLGAERGASEYHRSKLAAEEMVRAEAPDGWLIVRAGNVYGPGDEVISLLLKMVRALPLVPTLGWGEHPFQPVWHEDLGQALALAVERDAPRETALAATGSEVTSTARVLELLRGLTGKHPPRLPVPEAVARLGIGAAEVLGVDPRVSGDQITMLLEGSVVPEGEVNALTDVFGVTPLGIAEGLGRLVDEMPERLPEEGTGALEEQRYWVEIPDSRLSADALFAVLRRDFAGLAPSGLLEVGAEPGTPRELAEGNTLTMALPLRGNIQVRVAEVVGRRVTCLTLRGHPLSGAIRFQVEEGERGGVTAEIRSFTRASGVLDWVGMHTVGKIAQRSTWRSLLESLAERSGGTAPDGVQDETRALEGAEAEEVERWVEELALRCQRESVAEA